MQLRWCGTFLWLPAVPETFTGAHIHLLASDRVVKE